jgi:hypothetical protein
MLHAVQKSIDEHYAENPKTPKDVNEETLRKNVSRKLKRGESNHGNCLLTSEQELRIVGYFRALDVNGEPLTKSQAIDFVRKLHFSKRPGWNGYAWFKLFQQKYV